MRDTDIAYIAGLVDGEAYIGIKKSNSKSNGYISPRYAARLQIRMVDEQAIKFIANIFGGSYYKEKPSAKKGRPLFCYQASDKIAQGILEILLPYLKVKEESAKTILALRKHQLSYLKHKTKITGYRNFPRHNGKDMFIPSYALSDEYIATCESFYLQCKKLNKVGII